MTPGIILLIVLFAILLGTMPTWPYSTGWGYYPSGIAGTILFIALIVLLLGGI